MPTATVALTTSWVLVSTAASGVKVKPDLGADVLLSVNPTLPANDTTAISFTPEAGGWMTLPDLGSSNVYARVTAGTANLRVIPMAVGALPAGTQVIGATPMGASATVGAGTLSARIKSAATTNSTLVLTGARKLFGFQVFNTTAAKKYLKLYNKATAPVVGTDVPVATIEIQPNSPASYFNPMGKAFSLGLCYAITNLLADSDATAVAVDDVTGHLDYI